MPTDKIQAALDSVTRPDWVLSLRSQRITDADGEPAVAVWVVIRQGALDQANLGSRLNTLRRLIHDSFQANEIELWPFVRFESEEDSATRAAQLA